MKQNKHGGARIGSGRNLIYGEKTEVLQIVVPSSKKSEFEAHCREKLDTWLIKKPTKKTPVTLIDDGIDFKSKLEKQLDKALEKYQKGTLIQYKDAVLRVAFSVSIEGQSITAGCFTKENKYLPNVPIFQDGKWAKIVTVK